MARSTEFDKVIVDAMHKVIDASKQVSMKAVEFHTAEKELAAISARATAVGYTEDDMIDLYRKWADEAGIPEQADAAIAQREERKLYDQIGKG